MRYQLRLVERDLHDLTRDLAMEAWRTVDVTQPDRPGALLYRRLHRAVRSTLADGVEGFAYCGKATTCDLSLDPALPGGWKDARDTDDPDHVHRYLLRDGLTPDAFITELLRSLLMAAAGGLPHHRLKGLAPLLRRQIEKSLRCRLFRSDVCGESPLCAVNERLDPWMRPQLQR